MIKDIINELRSWAVPGIMREIVQATPGTLWFKIKGMRQEWVLLAAGDPFCGIYSTSKEPEEKRCESPFGVLLSKHMAGAEITDIRGQDLERIVHLDVIPRQAGHRLQPHVLIAELIDRSPNLILIEGDTARIVGCLRQVYETRRRIAPGEVYTPLPSSAKPNPLTLSSEAFREVFEAYTPGRRVSLFLVRNLTGLSPHLAEEVVARAGCPSSFPPDEPVPTDRLWKGLQEVMAAYGSSHPKPVVILPEDGDTPPVLSSFPLVSMAGQGIERRFSRMSEAAAFFHELIDRIKASQTIKKGLDAEIRTALKRYEKRLENLERDLDRLGDVETAKYLGDLIMTHLHLVRKGMREVSLPDLVRGEGEISITLDPAKGPVQNAQAYFKRHGKAKRGRAMVEERMAETERALRVLREAAHKLAGASDAEGVHEVELLARQVIRGSRHPHHPPRQPRKGPLPWGTKRAPQGVRLFTIDETWEVWVGKTDRGNDLLIRELAKPDDIWLHVHDAPGSHVLIKNPKRMDPVPTDVIAKAAGIAAYYSRMRDEGKVLVGYTQRRFVRKPKGMKPGQVLVDKQRTIAVEPSLPRMAEKKGD
ncbi:MAG: NFACT family protein [bacterium]